MMYDLGDKPEEPSGEVFRNIMQELQEGWDVVDRYRYTPIVGSRVVALVRLLIAKWVLK